MRHMLFILCVAHGASAAVLETLRDIPRGWQYRERAPSSRKHLLRIAMNNPHHDKFERSLLEISTPDHPRYGQYLTREELKEMLRPLPEATAAVMDWLFDAGVEPDAINDKGECINVDIPMITAERLLATKFNVYSNKYQDSETIVRTLEYSIPEHLHQHIDMIQPTTRFGEIRPQRSTLFDMKVNGTAHGISKLARNNSDCGAGVTPACLQKLYNIDTSDIKLKNKSVGFAAFNNFLMQYPRYKDLVLFEEQYATFVQGQNFTWSGINGGELDQNYSGDSGEANLDNQYLLATAHPVPIHAYSIGGLAPTDADLDEPNASSAQNEPYLDFLTYILDQPDDELPHTLSTSYGEDEQSSPLSYRINVCNMFGQLGARGVSVIFSSGDTGVGSACQTNDGKNTTRFLPIFPAACPFVTSVGGTTGTNPEFAASFSSGGFSDTWARPSWQADAVSTYLDILGDMWDGYYNKTGRGFPDVAMQSQDFQVVDKGLNAGISGTSAAAPAFAGVVALLNALRIDAGQKPLGFLNPFIYSSGYKGLNDITDGGSSGCNGTDIYSGKQTPHVQNASWKAVKGWDPVTGYGTPDFQKLRKLAMTI
ncbi:subtilisin-like protein [Acrodontium crateriforme]|uniref:tripeptidyl-peptidase II n=1 Tax=Acrodontium crateriforme TaxID=150365 RepID=A0AAQ3M5E9_9PEZI|nr:subtilisin-like protein [Acrodontium crateriforme]